MNDYFVHTTTELDENVTIGNGTKIWHFSHIMNNTIIGNNCNLGQNVVAGPDVSIGNGCKIQNNVSLYKGVTLEDDVFCGPSMVFTNVFNPRSHIKRMDEVRPTLVKKGASLGANCTIVCGVTIGKFAFVGAGAVVTKDVLDYALVMGNPAKQTGWICECGEKLNHTFECPVCGKTINPASDSHESVKPIAFVDLAAQQKLILPKIEKNIKTVLWHGKYIMGPEVKELEKRLADFVQIRHAVTCGSGTDALLMALMAYGIGSGDAVFTTPFTFIATAEVIKLLGATPVFVDIDHSTFNISVHKLKAAVREVSQAGQLRAKAIIPVDLFGLPCDYDQINQIASEYNLIVIEDAAQSFGAEYKGRMAGSLGDVGCTSFFPAKPLGCYGDGGAIFTDSDKLADKLRSIRVHGKGENKYDNIRLGLNGRLDTLQAAILLSKLEIFAQEMECRQKIAHQYNELLLPFSNKLELPVFFPGYKSAWAQYALLSSDKDTRSKILDRLKRSNIPTAVYYPTPLHLQTAFACLGYKTGDFPVSEDFSARVFSIPMHPYLTQQDQARICERKNFDV
ncbi:aminotransferase class I/II-fold pyridoxal phosphate-dependent enzyme [uncultured Desulfobacter sp.]|uniref:aminotransferase class I/II-fold pyridoxal phosphate-dependent enzyme n=1 Tax=uncultured Desulfobacter sp. TaxID=240139 RepID=UPI0029F50426|nr:aminotransferase class I/II-fold pyridoxal phosphate-dependent enzyme [uncultured Desulfobacter sp.]